jgi:hypothetical protein
MEPKLDIIGRVVDRACKVHDYVQIYFDNGSILNVFNKIGGGDLSDEFFLSLSRARVTEFELKEGAVSIAFSNGKRLKVGMTDDDYQSPEALELICSDGRLIVWR